MKRSDDSWLDNTSEWLKVTVLVVVLILAGLCIGHSISGWFSGV